MKSSILLYSLIIIAAGISTYLKTTIIIVITIIIVSILYYNKIRNHRGLSVSFEESLIGLSKFLIISGIIGIVVNQIIISLLRPV